MKCIKNGKEIKRVSDREAYQMVKQGWAFCPKHEWKEKVRDHGKGSMKISKDAIEIIPTETKETKGKSKYSKKQTKKDKDVAETVKATK